MYKYKLHIQGKSNPGEVQQALLDMAGSSEYKHLFAAVAYATKAGCMSLIDRWKNLMIGWTPLKKEWLISIDYGLTEPDALEYLRGLPNSEVRVPDGLPLIKKHLQPQRSFHPKAYFFIGNSADDLGLVSGSANLTLSGLLHNDEVVSSSLWVNPSNKRELDHIGQSLTQFDELQKLYKSSDIANTTFLKKYRRVWKKRRTKNEDQNERIRKLIPKNPVIEVPRVTAYSVAKSLWIDIEYVVENRGVGNPGNQIDLQRGSRIFFGFPSDSIPRNTQLGTVNIEYAGQSVPCNMRYGNNQMDKLNLPIPGNPGPPTYVKSTLRFNRLGPSTFELEIGSSTEIASWKSASRKQGSLYRMTSGREFGVLR